MQGQLLRRTFSGVDVGLPSQVRTSEAEEEWQEVEGVIWNTGELTVDGDNFLLVFKPSGGIGQAEGKPLGSMIHASAVPASDKEGRTFVVTTSDGPDSLYHLTFQSQQDVADFIRLAAAAEAANAASESAKDSSMGGDTPAATFAEAELEAKIREALSGRCPLIFGGVELFGSDSAPRGAGSGVSLGRGAAVLLDPPEDCKNVGSYELLIYSVNKGLQEPVKRTQIGPAAVLTKQQPEAEDVDGPGAAFALALGPQGLLVHTIAFEDAVVGACFARDFRVRQRLMEVALRTAKRGNTAAERRGEVEAWKDRSLGARLWRFARLCAVLLALLAAAHLAALYSKDKGVRPLAAYLADLKQDAILTARSSRTKVGTGGAEVCKVAFGSVPADDVRRCAAAASGAKSPSEVVRCLETLAGPRK